MSNGPIRLTSFVGAVLVLALGATAAAGADFVIGGTRVKAGAVASGFLPVPGKEGAGDRDPVHGRQRREERQGPGPGRRAARL